MVILRSNTTRSSAGRPPDTRGATAAGFSDEREITRVDYVVFALGVKKAITHGATAYQRADVGKDSLMAVNRAKALAQEIAGKLPK